MLKISLKFFFLNLFYINFFLFSFFFVFFFKCFQENERSLINGDHEIRKGLSGDYEKYSYSDVHKNRWSTLNDSQNTNETKESIFKKGFHNRNKKQNAKVIKDYLELIIKDLRHHIDHLKRLTYLNDIEITEQETTSKKDLNIGSNINIDDSYKEENSYDIDTDNVFHNTHAPKIKNNNNKNFTNAPIYENTDKKIQINNFLPIKPNQNISAFYESSNDNGFTLDNKKSSNDNGLTLDNKKSSNGLTLDNTNYNNLKLLEVKLQRLYQQLTFVKMAKVSPKDFLKVNCSNDCNYKVEKEKNNRTRSSLPHMFANENVDNLIHALTESISSGVINSVYKQGRNASNKEPQVSTIQTVRESINKLTEKYFMKKRADWISLLKEKWNTKPKTKFLDKLKNRAHRNNERVDNKSEITGASNKVNNYLIILQNNSNADKNSVKISNSSTDLSPQKERSIIEKKRFLMTEEKIDDGFRIGDVFKTKDAFGQASNKKSSFLTSQLQKPSELQENEESVSTNSEDQRFIKILKDYMANLRKIKQEKNSR